MSASVDRMSQQMIDYPVHVLRVFVDIQACDRLPSGTGFVNPRPNSQYSLSGPHHRYGFRENGRSWSQASRYIAKQYADATEESLHLPAIAFIESRVFIYRVGTSPK